QVRVGDSISIRWEYGTGDYKIQAQPVEFYWSVDGRILLPVGATQLDGSPIAAGQPDYPYLTSCAQSPIGYYGCGAAGTLMARAPRTSPVFARTAARA